MYGINAFFVHTHKKELERGTGDIGPAQFLAFKRITARIAMKCPGIVCWAQRFGTLPSADDAGPVDFNAVSCARDFYIKIARCGREIDAILIL